MLDIKNVLVGGEHLNGLPERAWAFRRPTVLIESQSAPILMGDAAEQAYHRAFPLATPKDLVVTDVPFNQTYIRNYLIGVLGLNLPEFIVVPDGKAGCLSDNLSQHPASLEAIRTWARKRNGLTQIQFFNVTQREKGLAEKLGIKTSCGDIEKAIIVGSKTGFRRLCESLGVPMPQGYICDDAYSTQLAVAELFAEGKEVLIKSENGTGGTELKSNILLTSKEWKESDVPLREYVGNKLAFFNDVLGHEWVVEEVITGEDGSVHVYIHDEHSADQAFILGALSQNNSYVGGYFPFAGGVEATRMKNIVDKILVPALQKMGVYGYHCFDFKDSKFLEDNARQGALDFIDGLVARVAEIHFPHQKYAYWHCHVPVHGPTSFDTVWDKLKPYLRPNESPDHTFGIVTNPQVLPFGRSLDLTAVSFGQGSSLGSAKKHFMKLTEVVESVL